MMWLHKPHTEICTYSLGTSISQKTPRLISQHLRAGILVPEDHVEEPTIESLLAEYDNADKLAQEVQKFRREAGVAAFNELRYAGFHLLQYCATNPPSRLELVRAINHSKRAAYEASEGGILAALKVVKRFQEDYKDTVVEPHVKDWPSKLKRCDEIVERLPRLRSDDEHLPHDHATAMQAYRDVKAIASETDYARPEINKQIAKEQRTSRHLVTGMILAAAGIAVALLLFALPYYIGSPPASLPSTPATASPPSSP